MRRGRRCHIATASTTKPAKEAAIDRVHVDIHMTIWMSIERTMDVMCGCKIVTEKFCVPEQNIAPSVRIHSNNFGVEPTDRSTTISI